MRSGMFTSTYAYQAESDEYDGENFDSEDSAATYEEVGYVAVSYDDSYDGGGDDSYDDSGDDSGDDEDDGGSE